MKKAPKRTTTKASSRPASRAAAAKTGQETGPKQAVPVRDARAKKQKAAAGGPSAPPAGEKQVKRAITRSKTSAKAGGKPAPSKRQKPSAAGKPAEEQLQAAGPGQRFALGPAAVGVVPQAAPAIEPCKSLPASYETGRLVIVSRDPHWLCVQWDVSTDQVERLKSLPKGKTAELRIFSGPSGKELVRRVPIVVPQRRRGTWFVEVPKGGELYVGEIGYQETPDNWVCITKSGVVSTPPTTGAAEGAYEVATIRLDEPVRPVPTAAPKDKGPETALRPSQVPAPEFPATIVPLAPEEPVFFAAEGQPSSLAFSPGQPFEAKPSEEFPSSVGVSRPEQAEKRGFWLNLNVELVVYGATDPGASLTIAGTPVRLRTDGTFSLRFSLPDGEHELAVEATAPEGTDRRSAILTVHRRTAYEGKVEPAPQSPKLAPPPRRSRKG